MITFDEFVSDLLPIFCSFSLNLSIQKVEFVSYVCEGVVVLKYNSCMRAFSW